MQHHFTIKKPFYFRKQQFSTNNKKQQLKNKDIFINQVKTRNNKVKHY